MNNFCILGPDNKEYWISRAMAVVVMVFAKDENGNKYILAVERGKGTPDPEYVGTYCLPCGYLDYNETLKQAAIRELKEETGLTASDFQLKLVSINDNPEKDKRQNVTFRYKIDAVRTVESLSKELTLEFSEKDEVSNIAFINLKNIDDYKWAFNHKDLIKEYSYGTINIRY